MSAARGQMVSLTDWMHERRAQAWWRPLDLGELVSARRPIPRTARGKTAPSPFQAAPKKAPAGPERVELSPGARSALAEQLALTADGTETGGALIGYVSDDGSTVLIEDASGPGRDADRTSVSVVLDYASSAFPLEDAYWSNGWRGRIIGNWHTHPRSGDGEPSSYDRENWRDSADRRDVWVGLIVSPGDDADWMWLDPRIDAYVTSRRDSRCRSVTLVNGDYAWR